MELAKTDRLVLINQYMILKLFDRDREDRYSELITTLEEGFEIFFAYVQDQISEEMSPAEGRFVYDVLSIYKCIEFYKRDNPASGIAHHTWVYFPGLGGKYESEYRTFTLFLIETYKKSTEQGKPIATPQTIDRHAPTLDKYKRMINEWNTLGRDLSSSENILQVLEA
jgi:uncharacterized protein YfbU (UPF0304 family)